MPETARGARLPGRRRRDLPRPGGGRAGVRGAERARAPRGRAAADQGVPADDARLRFAARARRLDRAGQGAVPLLAAARADAARAAGLRHRQRAAQARPAGVAERLRGRLPDPVRPPPRVAAGLGRLHPRSSGGARVRGLEDVAAARPRGRHPAPGVGRLRGGDDRRAGGLPRAPRASRAGARPGAARGRAVADLRGRGRRPRRARRRRRRLPRGRRLVGGAARARGGGEARPRAAARRVAGRALARFRGAPDELAHALPRGAGADGGGALRAARLLPRAARVAGRADGRLRDAGAREDPARRRRRRLAGRGAAGGARVRPQRRREGRPEAARPGRQGRAAARRRLRAGSGGRAPARGPGRAGARSRVHRPLDGRRSRRGRPGRAAGVRRGGRRHGQARVRRAPGGRRACQVCTCHIAMWHVQT